MAPPPLALSTGMWHVALVSPFPPAPSLLLTWLWTRQQQWRVAHGASQTGDLPVGAVFQLWQAAFQMAGRAFSEGEDAQLPLATILENATSFGVLGCLNTPPSASFFQRFSFQLDFCFRFRDFGNFCGMKFFLKLN